jgi:hypothetical protein
MAAEDDLLGIGMVDLQQKLLVIKSFRHSIALRFRFCTPVKGKFRRDAWDGEEEVEGILSDYKSFEELCCGIAKSNTVEIEVYRPNTIGVRRQVNRRLRNGHLRVRQF